MFLKSWPADHVEGLHVAVAFSPEAAAAAADDPTTRARDTARSIIVAIEWLFRREADNRR